MKEQQTIKKRANLFDRCVALADGPDIEEMQWNILEVGLLKRVEILSNRF